MIKPDFLIIGAMKCATTSLYAQFSLQPKIRMSSFKEPNFFSNDDVYANGIEWYQGLFGELDDGCLLGEASTHYTKLPTYPDTVERIHNYVPDVKLIYVMRHPIDRLISQYMHEWLEGKIRCDINSALKQFPEMIDYSRYHYQLLPYFDCFGKNQILPVFFERMLAFPQLELERICPFIGYQGTPTWHEIAPRNIAKDRTRKPVGYGRLIDSPTLQSLRRRFVSTSVRDFVKSRLNLSMGQRPEFDTNSMAMLEDVFDEDLALLGSKLGFHLDCKNFNASVKCNVLNWK